MNFMLGLVFIILLTKSPVIIIMMNAFVCLGFMDVLKCCCEPIHFDSLILFVYTYDAYQRVCRCRR